MRLTKQPHWRSKLFAEIEAARKDPFVYGQHDCGLWAARCVKAITDVDLAEDYRGKYETFLGGIKALRLAGYADHVAYAATMLPEVRPSRAQVGDLAVVYAEDGNPVLGVVIGSEILAPHPTGGIGAVPLMRAVRAFRVG